jgi:hypothetical protein
MAPDVTQGESARAAAPIQPLVEAQMSAADPSRWADGDFLLRGRITMADPVPTPRWYLQPGAWPYWLPNALAAFAAPGNDSSIQNSPQPASNGGILGLLAQPGAGLDQNKVGASGLPPVSGGILGMLTASPEAQTSSIPYWLQTAGHFGFGLGRPLPMSDAPQAASTPRWDSPAASTLSTLPSALFDLSTPYWLRTALPSGATSEGFEVADRSSEKPSAAAQLWPAASEEATTPSPHPPLLPGFSASANEDDSASWQESVSVSPARDSIFAPALAAPGISPPTPNYRASTR